MSEILSPPYPPDFISPSNMYRLCLNVHQWCEEEELSIRGTGWFSLYDNINVDYTLRTEPAYMQSAISDMFNGWMLLRRTREAHDALFRDFELDWGCEIAVARRISLLNSAGQILDQIGITAEVRAAKQLEHEEANRRVSTAIHNKLTTMSALARKTLREEVSDSDTWWDDIKTNLTARPDNATDISDVFEDEDLDSEDLDSEDLDSKD